MQQYHCAQFFELAHLKRKSAAAHREWDRGHQRRWLGDVIAIGNSQNRGGRCAIGVGGDGRGSMSGSVHHRRVALPSPYPEPYGRKDLNKSRAMAGTSVEHEPANELDRLRGSEVTDDCTSPFQARCKHQPFQVRRLRRRQCFLQFRFASQIDNLLTLIGTIYISKVKKTANLQEAQTEYHSKMQKMQKDNSGWQARNGGRHYRF